METLALLFAKPAARYALAAIGAVLLVGGAIAYVYHKGETAGSSSVTSAVEHTTNTETEKARKAKEAADAKARTAPIDDVIDRTR